MNGFLAMCEIAVVSARKVRLQQLCESGKAGARVAMELAEQPARFLSTVQVGITLVGILAGVFSGATLADELARVLGAFPVLAPHSQTVSLFCVVLGVTTLTLVLGELVPKQIALHKAETIAAGVAPFMLGLSRLASPVVRLLSFSSNLVVRLAGIRPSEEPSVTEEDIKILLEQGEEDGVFEPKEGEMVQQVFRLGDQRVSELMTPRLDVVFLDVEETCDEIREKIATSGFSRFPLVQGGMDHILGLVRAKDLLPHYMLGECPDLKTVAQPGLFVPENTPVMQLLEEFREKRLHMAFVLDEYGNIQGILTPTDILEAIVGDMPDMDETYEPEVVQREDGSWLMGGMISLDKLKETLDVKELPNEEENAYQTLGGLLMMVLSKVPAAGDVYEWNQLRFEVVDMDGHRVDKVLVRRLPGSSES